MVLDRFNLLHASIFFVWWADCLFCHTVLCLVDLLTLWSNASVTNNVMPTWVRAICTTRCAVFYCSVLVTRDLEVI